MDSRRDLPDDIDALKVALIAESTRAARDRSYDSYNYDYESDFRFSRFRRR